MAKPNRDDFLASTKRTLAARVSNVCSYPGCQRSTSGPSAEGPDRAINAGEAAHIRGAREGSKRYVASMTGAERRSVENGIWLCSTHHTIVDSDEATFTVEELERWKEEAEARAAQRLLSGTSAALKASRLYGTPRTPSGKFVGRKVELAGLRRKLQQSTAVRITASVEGLPGIGKTELALQLVYRLARDGAFPGGIFWFDAEDPDLVPTWGGAIANALEAPPGPLEERAAHALRIVNGNPAPTLVVLDNVESWNADRQPAPLPGATHVRFLATTRQRNLGGAQFDDHVEVGFLDAKFARQLLEAVSGRELAKDPAFEELVKHLGGHALAVELAGAFLGTYRGETPASYLAELRARGDVEGEASDLVRYGATVSQAFETLWDRLDEDVRAAWRLAACFEPEPVTAELSAAVGLTGPSFRSLERLHLVDVDDEGRWWMHRLPRQFGQGVAPANERRAAQVAFVEGCARFAGRIELADGFRHYLPSRLHLDAAVSAALEVLPPSDPTLCTFLSSIDTGRHSSGDLQGSRKLSEEVLALAIENHGDSHHQAALCRSNLALVLKDLGDLEAAKALLEQALSSDLESFGGTHPSVARDRSNLAAVLQDLGDLEAAKVLLEQALSSAMESFGTTHPNVAKVRLNLALVLQDLGDLETARSLLEQALSSDLKSFGGSHPAVARDRSYLAGVLQDLGDKEGVRDQVEKATRIASLHPEGSLVRLRVETAMRRILEKETDGGLPPASPSGESG